jgi:hypothetical protein
MAYVGYTGVANLAMTYPALASGTTAIAAENKSFGQSVGGSETIWMPIRDRSITKSKNVLIVYDLNSVHPGQYDVDVNPATIAATITTQETSLGFFPTTVTSYAALNAMDITNYCHIWDVGYDTLITAPTEAQYTAYLASGGAAFLLGENGYFVQRDSDIDNFVTVLGGGTVTASTTTTGIVTATIAPEFRLANPSSTVQFNNVGNFTAQGTGTTMAYSGSGVNAAVWQTGSLANSLTAAICIVLDINFLVAPDTQPQFIDDVSIVLNVK